jgi:hypothetical protein
MNGGYKGTVVLMELVERGSKDHLGRGDGVEDWLGE